MNTPEMLYSLLLLVAALATGGRGATIDVPGDYSSIQDAINAASDGDSVLVQPGTYLEHDLDFGGRAITVTGTAPEDSAVVAATLIDAEGQGRGFEFDQGEGASSVVSGLSITGGTDSRDGGGVFCFYASPTFIRCFITNNSAGWDGAGVFGDLSSATFERCIFADNQAGRRGGGVFLEAGAPSMVDCRSVRNSASNGGGFYLLNSQATVTDCLISDNSVNASGGGIYCSTGAPTLTRCRILGNTGGDDGGGIHCGSSTASLSNCYIADNSIGDDGGGVFCGTAGAPAFMNCTITANSASEGGGSYLWNATSTFTNCILWGNSPDAIVEDGSTATVTYSDVEGTWPGEGNIGVDPELFLGDFHLQSNSPCINTGTSVGAPQEDLDGDPRPIGFEVDIGADEQIPLGLEGNAPNPPSAAVASLGTPSPNPFNPRVEIPYELHVATRHRIAVYGIRGDLVRVLVDASRPAGSHRIGWNGMNEKGAPVASGVYHLSLETSSRTLTRKLLLLK
ncbi:MAG: hypothetical protein CME06_02175 [Gemmatimonadetes bacterium]|nr:hypothetical protein [Gemmatimonadota bacterium]